MSNRAPELEALLERARQDEAVLAVMLFGSAARGEAQARSDVDVCLVLHSHPQTQSWSPEALARKRLEYLHFDLDVKVFQALPLYVRQRVLKEGRVLLVKDEDQLYELAFRTVQEFEDFKHIYREYLEAVARGEP
jgi:hypothetical protein